MKKSANMVSENTPFKNICHLQMEFGMRYVRTFDGTLMKQKSTVMMEYLKLLNTYKDPIKLGKY